MFRTQVRMACMLLVLGSLTLTNSLAALAQDEATPADAGAPSANFPVSLGLRADGQGDGARLTVELSSGQQRELTVWLGNFGEEPVEVVSYTADATTQINGGLDIGGEDEEQHEPTTWLTYPTETHEIAPGQEVAREFTVSVPPDATPGEYVIPLAVETVDSYAVSGSSQFRQKIRKAMLLVVIVPGDYSASFELGDPVAGFDRDRLAIEIPVTNTGQTILLLAGNLTLSDADGTALLDTPLRLLHILGGQETIVQLLMRGTIPAGDYHLSIELADDATGVSSGFENRTISIPEPPVDLPLDFESITVEPNADPIQFADVNVVIGNTSQSYRSTRLTLVVTKDDEPLEEFVLADNALLDQGVTIVSQRYIPIDGWTSGTYSFALKLEAIEPGSGGVTLLLTREDAATIVVP